MDIAELILQTMEDTGVVAEPGTMAFKMLEMARKAMIPDAASDADKELEAKIKELRKYEAKEDLAWLDFPSWNSLSTPTHQAFAEKIEPLFWGGLYFSYSKFLDNMQFILKDMESSVTINIQKEGRNYRFVCLNASSSIYDYFGMTQLNRIRVWYESTRHKSIGKTFTGELIVKDFKEGRWV